MIRELIFACGSYKEASWPYLKKLQERTLLRVYGKVEEDCFKKKKNSTLSFLEEGTLVILDRVSFMDLELTM